MTKKIAVVGAVAALALAANLPETQAFAPVSMVPKPSAMPLFAEESAFKPSEAVEEGLKALEAKEKEDVPLEAAEMLGRGSAKVCCLIF